MNADRTRQNTNQGHHDPSGRGNSAEESRKRGANPLELRLPNTPRNRTIHQLLMFEGEGAYETILI